MKTLLLGLLLCAALPAAGWAETQVSGFNPRFGASSAFPDTPEYHPPERPSGRFDIGIDVDPFGYRDRDRCRDRRDCRRRDRR